MKTAWIIISACLAGIAFRTSTPESLNPTGYPGPNQENSLQAAISGKTFSFKAGYAIPMRGRMRVLTDDYELRVEGDSIQSDLPYFGEEYIPPSNLYQNGIQFLSRKFDYQWKNAKNGSWDVLIKPQDVANLEILSLHINSNRTASLFVNFLNKQGINFNGEILPPAVH
ncbi:MAG TPA: DUF4251 domain-containing protein [Chitinophagaceae bacterium]|nr:DUF4251 domain-containing protein [Chitinophagaceae bacterium]